jgi:hypothetical protein
MFVGFLPFVLGCGGTLIVTAAAGVAGLVGLAVIASNKDDENEDDDEN